jgi:hypothetical protein
LPHERGSRVVKILVATSVGLALGVAPQMAAAKLACYPLDKLEQALGAEYGERPQFAGRESEGVEYRLYVNARTGSWSWVGIPAGTKIGCLIFAGKAHESMPALEPRAKPEPPAQF